MSRIPRVVPAWLLSRVLLLVLVLVPSEQAAVGDLSIYHRWSLDAWCHNVIPGRDYPWEYPPGALPFAALPLGCSSPREFISWYLGLALLADLTVLLSLLRLPRGSRAGWVWVTMLPLVGPVVMARFDIVASLLVAIGFIQLSRRPAVTGALLTVATAVKLWPALVLALVVTTRRRLRGLIGGAVVTAVALAGVFALLGTLGAFRTALRYQSDRGLQIESLPALPWVWARVSGDARYRYAFGGWQVEGTGTTVAAAVAVVVAAIAVVLILWHAVRVRPDQTRLASLTALAVAVVLATDKVLSPQYLLWLGIAVAVLAGYTRLSRPLLASVFTVAALTHVIYPLGYHQLLIGNPWLAAVVTARDLGLVVVAALLFHHLLRHTSSEEPA